MGDVEAAALARYEVIGPVSMSRHTSAPAAPRATSSTYARSGDTK